MTPWSMLGGLGLATAQSLGLPAKKIRRAGGGFVHRIALTFRFRVQPSRSASAYSAPCSAQGGI